MQKYLDADDKLSNSSLKIDYYDTMLVYLESILKVIQNRTYQIKNAIEFMRFNFWIRLMINLFSHLIHDGFVDNI